ncbi:MAG TPA: T9SS type A sorting domain-containing protein, partial [Chitinophagaceae bacterium]
DVLHVRTPFADGSMEIVDSEGKLMKKITITDFTTDVSIQQLAKGIYIIRVKHKKDAVAEKFIKT